MKTAFLLQTDQIQRLTLTKLSLIIMPNSRKNQRDYSCYDSNGGQNVASSPALLDIFWTQICTLVYKAEKPPLILGWGVSLCRLPTCMLEQICTDVARQIVHTGSHTAIQIMLPK